MADWEESVFPKCKSWPTYYWRHLDNVWGVWEDTEDFLEFVDTLNGHHTSIQVKVEKKKDRRDFLDTTIFKGSVFQDSGRMSSKEFFKSTDTHALLHRGSIHDAHVFKGTVKAQLLRFRY